MTPFAVARVPGGATATPAAGAGVAVRLNGSGPLRLEGKGSKIVGSADVADDTWHHVAVPCRFL
ncbi:MAG: hypothetical protein BRD40_03390 [Bacteroidetes bacterium QS_1_65_9]|nr:MAG: hypothetical protein BRD40_03390 [Bacteroidetes bacterium QS_1_65_9]